MLSLFVYLNLWNIYYHNPIFYNTDVEMPEPRISGRVKTKTDHYRADNPTGNVTANTLTGGATGMCP